MALGGCTSGPPPLFDRLSATRTGIDFNNVIAEDDSLMNPFDMTYIYNGAGVAVGDFDGDDRPDLYFGGNQVESKLYLNRGNFQFDDVTDAAGVAAEKMWVTGVATVDINQDGLLDLYVCVAGPRPAEARANLLFVNYGLDDDGVPRFEERAAAYGIDDTGYSTQAAFFDYDRDGDLDLYLLTNALEDVDRNSVRPKRIEGEAESTDRLYRNNGDGTFTDVSREAGILIEGYGLGVVVSDIDRDGWPDVYVANDFVPNEVIYRNNGDGTFTDKAPAWLRQQSHNGMGADVADYNNDGRLDIVVLDMLPPDNYRQKMMASITNRDGFQRAIKLGYQPQYVRNTLQLNRSAGPDGELIFSEIAQLAGVDATDWSWAPLFADFDNDGWKDLFVSNGYGKDVTNLDLASYGNQISAFGTEESKREAFVEAYKELSTVEVPNVMYRNDGDLTFTDQTEAWGMGPPSISTGAAFADLDSDGDLDLVVSNINDEAFILKNRLAERDTAQTYLRVRLQGPPGNREGLGTKLALQSDGQTQYHEHTLYRGYKSTVESTIHFGLGTTEAADTLEVRWPDGRIERRTDVVANQEITLRYEDATSPEAMSSGEVAPIEEAARSKEQGLLFTEEAAARGLTYVHEEYEVYDFRRIPLLPYKLSEEGPPLAVGDVDGDGRDDVFVGADRGRERTFFLQTAPGQFEARSFDAEGEDASNSEHPGHEDRGALLFDADGDSHLDLFVASGGTHARAGDIAYQDRLYLGDGTGSFRQAEAALPELTASSSVATAADYDGDGDLDLFVGGRVVPDQYPLPARSYLLENRSEEGQARFVDVTEQQAPELAEAGMVTDALWTDTDGDGHLDLLVAGDWMPIRLFRGSPSGVFEEATAEAGLDGTAGWWRSLTAADFDGDGDLDYVAGNLGSNASYRASTEEPVRIYAKDFDRNGSLDPVMSRYIDGEEVPVPPRDLLIEQMPAMKARFPSYASYAEASFEDVFTERELEDAYVAETTHLETSYLENREDSTFQVRPLPIEAQFAPVFGLRAGDYDGDGNADLLTAGNFYSTETITGWQDASVGLLLRGDGEGGFEPVSHSESGFFVRGDAKALAEVVTGETGPPLALVTQSSDSLKAFARQAEKGVECGIRLRPTDRAVEWTFEDGSRRREEAYYGSSYLAQSSRVLCVPEAAVEAVIIDGRGQERTLNLDAVDIALTNERKPIRP